MEAWQLQAAKARLSEVIKKTVTEGPQKITLHGEPAAVIMSSADYETLKKPRSSFVELMRDSPLLGIEIDLKRGLKTPGKADV